MLFGSRRFTQLDQLPEVMIHHEKIPFVEHYKYLRITLDNNLNFQKHMTEVCSIVATSYMFCLKLERRPCRLRGAIARLKFSKVHKKMLPSQ